MPSHHLDDDPFSFEFLAEFLAAFDFGGFVPADGSLFSSNLMMPPFCSLLRATWGLEIIAVVATRSVVQTASISEGVSKNPVGIVNFYDQRSPAI
jgi:hypothetical protein